MTDLYRLFSFFTLGLTTLHCVACADEKRAPNLNSGDGDTEITLPAFQNVPDAPSAIRNAAKAVVRIRTARSAGTGSFISSTGLLLTNNHVLGGTVCPIEGCLVTINESYEVGSKYQQGVKYHAVPVTFDSGLDTAVVQLFSVEDDTKPNTPNYLTIAEQTSTSLLGKHVTVVGHPNGRLKKWTDGTVVDAYGEWLVATNFILPGDSGSPILNDDGKFVGIVHRSQDSFSYISEEGVNVSTIGSASKAIKAALDAPLPDAAISVKDSFTKDDFLANEEIFLNSNTTSVTIDTTSVKIIDLIGTACDAALNDHDAPSITVLEERLAPCYAAMDWLECREDVDYKPYGHVCPDEDLRQTWRDRFQALNAIELSLNGIPELEAVSYGIAQLENDSDAGVAAGKKSLEALLNTSTLNLDFQLTYFLSDFGFKTYQETALADYIIHFAVAPGYTLDIGYITYSAINLYIAKELSSDQFTKVLTDLLYDPSISITARLLAESILYEVGLL
jgi:hypothetical protein